MKRPKSTAKKASRASPAQSTPGAAAMAERFPILWAAGLMALTGVLFSPILGNQFTNWDDQFYVVENTILPGPDWKRLFSEPVVSNYHPLTILTLALNYQLSGLEPFSYFLVNGLLHVANTGLVFYLTWLLAGRQRWVALFVAAVFSLHPMHVESVAWISERKDVLYAFFYLIGLIAYWRYLSSRRRSAYGWTLLAFVLSLLSKPAAVAFPLTLLTLDYWHGRSFRQRQLWLEKAPFFALALVMGIITVLIQSKKAMASIEMYSLVDRFFFGCYTILAYVGRFFWPWPLSPFHPYPPANALGWPIYIAPVLLMAAAGAIGHFRRYRALVFGALFYLANIILVAQFVSIGNTLLAERYTYVPYIGIAFTLAMLIAHQLPVSLRKPVGWAVLAIAIVGYGWLTRQYLKTWRDTESLWETAIRHAPKATVPRSNRAHHYYQLALLPENAGRMAELMKKAAEDCDAALAVNPNHKASLDIRILVHVRLGEFAKALPLADRYRKIAPQDPKSHVLYGTVLQRMKRYDEAIEAFNQALALDPNNVDALNGRGASRFNGRKEYREALADFEKAIALQPTNGMAHLNRSRCYYMLGNWARAREDAAKARALGTAVPDDYWQLIHR